MDLLDKLLARTAKQENGCMLWNGALGGVGLYGQVSIKGKLYRVHRLVFKETNNINIDELCVLHKCDTPACVNPEHLFAGTRKDNMKDLLDKDRLGRNARFSRDDILKIRELATTGVTALFIAERFDTTARYINKILSREIWKHV